MKILEIENIRWKYEKKISLGLKNGTEHTNKEAGERSGTHREHDFEFG